MMTPGGSVQRFPGGDGAVIPWTRALELCTESEQQTFLEFASHELHTDRQSFAARPERQAERGLTRDVERLGEVRERREARHVRRAIVVPTRPVSRRREPARGRGHEHVDVIPELEELTRR